MTSAISADFGADSVTNQQSAMSGDDRIVKADWLMGSTYSTIQEITRGGKVNMFCGGWQWVGYHVT